MKIYGYNPKTDHEFFYYITEIDKKIGEYILHTEVFLWYFPVRFVNDNYCPEHISHLKLSKYTNRQKEILRRLSEKEIK